MTISFNYLTKTKAIWHTRSMATIYETKQLIIDIVDEVMNPYKHRHDAKIYVKDYREIMDYLHELSSAPIKPVKAERLNCILMRIFLIYIRNLKQLRLSEQEQTSFITNSFKRLGYQHVENG